MQHSDCAVLEDSEQGYVLIPEESPLTAENGISGICSAVFVFNIPKSP